MTYLDNKISTCMNGNGRGRIWLSWELEGKRPNQINHFAEEDSLPLVTVLMAFQTGGIRFVLSIADWSLLQWDLFDVKNKGFLLGYTGQDWWCVKSRPQRGKQRKTLSSSHGKITFSPKTFCKSSLENRLSTNTGEPSHKTELQRTQGSGFSVFGKARTKVAGSFPASHLTWGVHFLSK